MCFCCSHLTAGQSAYRERNAEVLDISQRLLLAPDKRSVLSHDYVFWFGDLNYRINLPNEEVKTLISRSAWSDLQCNDQLLVQRKADAVFKGFNEGPLCFAPTYKYDLFCDDYDTSEKARSPSWTDRILWRRANITFKKASTKIDPADQMLLKNLLTYYRAEIKTSDHRPVAAVFDIDIQVVRPVMSFICPLVIINLISLFIFQKTTELINLFVNSRIARSLLLCMFHLLVTAVVLLPMVTFRCSDHIKSFE